VLLSVSVIALEGTDSSAGLATAPCFTLGFVEEYLGRYAGMAILTG